MYTSSDSLLILILTRKFRNNNVYNLTIRIVSIDTDGNVIIVNDVI
jgi:hypothetical protein